MAPSNTKAPCKGCEEREPGCHGKCPWYAKYKEEHQMIVEKIRNEHQYSRTGLEYYIKAHKHYKKSGVG